MSAEAAACHRYSPKDRDECVPCSRKERKTTVEIKDQVETLAVPWGQNKSEMTII